MFFSSEMKYLISCMFFVPSIVGAAGAVPGSASIVFSTDFDESSVSNGVIIRI